ncbi:MAG TPA: hypothetical protein VH678_08725 [Xanthobacteraceae bacterium]|jgi:hypothetical protein
MREIIESEHFKAAVEALGGHRAIDEALEPIMEALHQNPHGFPSFRNQWVSFHYARIKGLARALIPPLLLMFIIEANGDVILDYIEEDQDAD